MFRYSIICLHIFLNKNRVLNNYLICLVFYKPILRNVIVGVNLGTPHWPPELFIASKFHCYKMVYTRSHLSTGDLLTNLGNAMYQTR